MVPLAKGKNLFINPEDFTYDLPQDRIASFPLAERDQSRLLFYNKGRITHHIFSEFTSLIPENSLLVFNNSKVIPARLHFRKSTGAIIEIFLLKPVLPSSTLADALSARTETLWECMIGNLKKWHDPSPLIRILKNGNKEIELIASMENHEKGWVRLQWNDPSFTLNDILTLAGKIPLPPYISREPVEDDKIRYQTVYSEINGAVASSTAGLHFTSEILEDLNHKNIPIDFITLHVGAGTFQPIKTTNAYDHKMHSEQIIISLQNLNNLLYHKGPIISVGTTSLRTLESLYWFGTSLLFKNQSEFKIEKLEPYNYDERILPTREEALNSVKEFFLNNKIDSLTGETEIYILPGYQFKICDGLITNYHLPGSTLILLVAAFIGNDWKRIYAEAIMNDYRFLSYGDASLIIP